MDIDAFKWLEPEECFRTILHPQFIKIANLPKLSKALCLSCSSISRFLICFL